MSQPLVTVLVTTQGADAQGIMTTLADARAQTWPNRKLVVVGPGPDLPGVTRLENPRFAGEGPALLYGLRHAKGRWVAWFPAGSRAAPDRIVRQVQALHVRGDFCALSWRGAETCQSMRIAPGLLFADGAEPASLLIARARLPKLEDRGFFVEGLARALAARVACETTGAVTLLKSPLVTAAPKPSGEADCEEALAIELQSLCTALGLCNAAPPNGTQQRLMQVLLPRVRAAAEALTRARNALFLGDARPKWTVPDEVGP